MQYEPFSRGTHARRRTTQAEMERRSFSPKYKPLLEERESVSEGSLHSEEGSSLVEQSGRQAQGEYQERVLILSDRGGDGEANGDADSGISLSDMVGEDHPAGSGKSLAVTLEKPEPLLLLVVQIVIPFFFAGFGMMAAGLLLDAVQVS